MLTLLRHLLQLYRQALVLLLHPDEFLAELSCLLLRELHLLFEVGLAFQGVLQVPKQLVLVTGRSLEYGSRYS